MLDHGRQRHVEWLRELADRRRAARQALDHAAARRIGQRPEGEVERRHPGKNFKKGSASLKARATEGRLLSRSK